MLWGEVAAILTNDRQSYELILGQANWLFEISRPADAAFWFEQLIDARFDIARDPESHTKVRIRLGHCYLRMGNVEEAGKLWEAALTNASAQLNIDEKASFSYNLGHVRHRQGRWEDAINLYQDRTVQKPHPK
jgi:tetratricopeptide (TPR) repeat protein